MAYYYVALATRSQAFLLERRMKNEGVECELTFMPRTIMKDLCNMGVRFRENVLPGAVEMIRRSGLPTCRLYKEILHPGGAEYIEVKL